MKLACQFLVRKVGASDHHHSRGFTIEAVYDSRSARFSDRGQLVGMPQ
jgi:hypothetical protein